MKSTRLSFPRVTAPHGDISRRALSGGVLAAGLLIAAATLSGACGKSGGSQPGASGGATSAKTIMVINTNASDPAPKAAFETLVRNFHAAHPDIEVKVNIFDHEGFKTSVRNFLTSQPPDVITWFAGNRMRAFVEHRLLEDVSDVWNASNLSQSFAAARPTVTVDGKQYGVPYTYYQWGIFYRKDLFEAAGITSPPTTWDEFLAAGKALRARGVSPVAIGTKFLWPAAGWFDYLDLRVNGLDFHMALMEGKVSYLDERVKKVFSRWRELIDHGFFIDNHATYSWQEAQAFLYQGKAAMYLMGSMLVPTIPQELTGKIGFFQFPRIDPAIGMYEDAPTDTLHIPARARNKEAARKFLAFAARAEVQGPLNDTLQQLPPNQQAKIADNEFSRAGKAVLEKAAGLAQFYDRDTRPEMAQIGMEGFQEFMVNPDRLDTILDRLEKARQRIFRTR
jgi:multiple sugar transport system substrate-binding protein